MQFKKVLSAILACVTTIAMCVPTTVMADSTSEVNQTGQTEEFYDDFSGDTLDTSKWLVAEKMWGGWNGGVVPENVSVSDGTLKLEGHGNLYTGDVKGCNEKLGGIRTGAAIATRDYYASGSYEVVAKVAPVLGACSAIWTFEYEEYSSDSEEYKNYPDQTGTYAIVNHEIDIELPTANDDYDTPTFHAARFNTYEMENRSKSNFQTLPEAVDDGQWHTYRFDWHTGDEDEQTRVEFYVDGQLLYTSYEHIPTNASRLWLGLWFPSSKDSDGDGYGDTGWTGTADFDTTVFEIDSVKITPYCEAGDTVGNESYPKDGWAANSFPEDIEAENYEHILNGDFSAGSENWTISGDAEVSDGCAVLKTGSVTRTLSQKITVQPNMTYTLKADVVSDGTKVTLGVRKANGLGNVSKTYTDSGEKLITFTTEKSCTEMEVYVQVERYQDGDPAYVDNVSVVSGESEETSVSEPTTDTENTDTPDSDPTTDSGDTDTPDTDPTTDSGNTSVDNTNLLINGDFSAGSDNWSISGGAEVSEGRGVLNTGSATRTLSQKITVQPNTTYTLKADIVSDGTKVTLGARKANGTSNTCETFTDSGEKQITFTTGDGCKEMEIYVQVERYQNGNSAYVDNISVVNGESVNTSDSDPTIDTDDTDTSDSDPTTDTEDTDTPDSDPTTGTEDTDTPDSNPTTDTEDTDTPAPETTPDSGSTSVESTNILSNGDFTDGTDSWKISGSAVIENGAASLASGSDTDRISQKITVEKGKTYTLTVDVASCGADLQFGVNDYNGRYTKVDQTVSEAGQVTLTFTTASYIDNIEVYVQVLRYQSSKDPVVINAISLTEAE